ncbi:MAG: MFS transporter [Planctomycetales bacterium]|nr:MFS transporter [Planctomycetales bacterium]
MSRVFTFFRSANYGWVIVVIAALAMVATLPGRTHGLGMITERLLADERFHLDRIGYSNINLWATLLGGLFCLPCGWLIDRCGLRVTLTATVAALACAVLWMTRVPDASQLSLALLLTRGFGQSALSVISITMVGKWFPDRPSVPMAVYSLLLSLGFAFAPQVAKGWATADWRVVWGGMGYVLLAFVPVALVITRDPSTPSSQADSSADLRLPVDGTCCAIPDASPASFTLGEAVCTQTFWLFGITISLVALIGSGLSLFNESVLNEQGFPAEVYYNLITFTGIVGLLAKLPIGWLGQYVPLNRLLAVGLLMQAVCMACLPLIHTQLGIRLYGAGMGIAGSITTVLFFTIWSHAFGRAQLGQIQAVSQMMTVLASALGPRVFAECFSRFGSYKLAFLTLSAVTVALAGWSCLVRVPRPGDAPHAKVVA